MNQQIEVTQLIHLQTPRANLLPGMKWPLGILRSVKYRAALEKQFPL